MSRSTAPTPERSRDYANEGGPQLRAALLLCAGLALALATTVRIRFRAYLVSGRSMEPAYREGDYLLVDRRAYRSAMPHRFDVVVARHPANPEIEVVKRVQRVDLHRAIWIEGDNAAESTDSRDYGPLTRDALVGKVLFRYWPLNRSRGT